jgi:hypothetical protein
MHGHGV